MRRDRRRTRRRYRRARQRDRARQGERPRVSRERNGRARPRARSATTRARGKGRHAGGAEVHAIARVRPRRRKPTGALTRRGRVVMASKKRSRGIAASKDVRRLPRRARCYGSKDERRDAVVEHARKKVERLTGRPCPIEPDPRAQATLNVRIALKEHGLLGPDVERAWVERVLVDEERWRKACEWEAQDEAEVRAGIDGLAVALERLERLAKEKGGCGRRAVPARRITRDQLWKRRRSTPTPGKSSKPRLAQPPASESWSVERRESGTAQRRRRREPSTPGVSPAAPPRP